MAGTALSLLPGGQERSWWPLSRRFRASGVLTGLQRPYLDASRPPGARPGTVGVAPSSPTTAPSRNGDARSQARWPARSSATIPSGQENFRGVHGSMAQLGTCKQASAACAPQASCESGTLTLAGETSPCRIFVALQGRAPADPDDAIPETALKRRWTAPSRPYTARQPAQAFP